MQRRRDWLGALGGDRCCWLLLAGSLTLTLTGLLSGACGDDADLAAASGRADAGSRQTAARDGSTPQLSATRSFSSALARLTELADAAADGGTPALSGKARFRQTEESVDLEVALQACVGEAAYKLVILEASDCSAASLRAEAWGEGRGQGLPTLYCAGTGVGLAGASYMRPNKKPAAWTVDDGSASDVVGRVLVVLGRAASHPLTQSASAESLVPVACGVIERAEDLQRSALPSDDQAPGIATRAAIGGACLQRQFASDAADARCPDDAALLRCEATHCDIGNCLQTCQPYASCLDQQASACAPSGTCAPSAECAMCKNDLQQCALGFCAEHALCGGSPTPDGPCLRLAGCCALQGAEAGACLGLLPLLSSVGGDGNCISGMMDWDVLTHLHVPCTYGPLQLVTDTQPGQTSDPAQAPLADQHAGRACSRDADCPGGRCQAPAAVGGASSGFCTRSCETTSECGSDGLCVGATNAKQCLAVCSDQSECRDGFVCVGGSQGSRISLPGACRPKRQVDQLADGVAGRACSADAECAGGKCAAESLLGTSYPGNYCSARCYEDAHCGQGGVCLWTHVSSDPGFCLQGCSTDADCTREDYGCWELNDSTHLLHGCYPRMPPLPDQRTGSACTQDAECGAAHASCAKTLPTFGLASNEQKDVPGGYCTQRCALDIECGAGAQCINYGTSGGLCLASCSTDKPCRDGYACYAHARDNDAAASVCVAPF